MRDLTKELERDPRHGHPCPVCYEAPVCDMRTCSIMVDFGRSRDGFLMGGHCVCDSCKGTVDDIRRDAL